MSEKNEFAACSPDVAYLWENRTYAGLARISGVPFIDLRSFRIPGGILRKIPAHVVRSRRCVPMIFNPRRVVLIVDDPFQAIASDPWEVRSLFGPPWNREVGYVLATPSALTAFIEEKYPSGQTTG